MPSPVGPRQGHLASGAMHPPLLHFPRLSLPRRAEPRLMHRIAPLQLSCTDSAVPLLLLLLLFSAHPFLSPLLFFPLIFSAAAGRSTYNRQVTQLQSSLFLSLSAFRATRVSCLGLSTSPLSSRDSKRARPAIAADRPRCASPFFSHPVNPRPLLPLVPLCRYKYPPRRYF